MLLCKIHHFCYLALIFRTLKTWCESIVGRNFDLIKNFWEPKKDDIFTLFFFLCLWNNAFWKNLKFKKYFWESGCCFSLTELQSFKVPEFDDLIGELQRARHLLSEFYFYKPCCSISILTAHFHCITWCSITNFNRR